MHQRAEKSTPVDTILYEVDMFHFCGGKVSTAKKTFDKTRRDDDRLEYYLAVEGFLLHLRNLLSFFTNRMNETTDLIINQPTVWAGHGIDQQAYSDLIAAADAVDKKYGRAGRTCYDLISKFLEHCTTHRHTDPQFWEIEHICLDMDVVLSEFDARFIAHPVPSSSAVDPTGNSTATVRHIGACVPDDAPTRIVRIKRR